MPSVWLPTLRLYLRDFWIRLSFFIALCLALLTAIVIISWGPHGASVPLHYNVYFGIDLIGGATSLWWLPFIAICLVFMNASVALHLWRSDRMLSYFVGAGTTFTVAIILAATILIAIINRQ